jgi:hypothetical protein
MLYYSLKPMGGGHSQNVRPDVVIALSYLPLILRISSPLGFTLHIKLWLFSFIL